MNMVAHIDRAASQFPDRIALSDPARSLSYAQLQQRGASIAAWLQDRGLRPGDRVAVYGPNHADYMVLLYAVLRAGGVFVPLNYRFADQDLAFVLNDSESRFLAVEGGDWERLAPVLSGTAVEHVLVRGGRLAPGDRRLPTAVDLESLLDTPGSPEGSPVPRRDGDDALLMYTSGTTGRPKGVRQTHRNNTAAMDMVVEAWRLTARDRLLQALPLFHVGGLQCTTLPALAVGAETHFLPRWDGAAWLQALEAVRPTFSGLVTTMLIDVLTQAERGERLLRPSTLRFVVFGGSATPTHIPQRFEEALRVPLVELYGQTETSGLIATYEAGERRVAGSLGRVRAAVADAVLLDPSGRVMPLREGSTGEIAFAGDIVTPGYWRAPAETESRRVGDYLRTGDIMRVGQDGWLYYVDRADNMIVSGGENIYPAEVEEVLARHADVEAVAVVGTPHPRLVQQVTAIVVPRSPALTDAALTAFLDEDGQLAPYKRPRRFEFVAALPKTGSGKVDRGQLQRIYGSEPHPHP